LREPISLGRVPALQVTPPSVVTEIWAASILGYPMVGPALVSPAATQKVAAAQDMGTVPPTELVRELQVTPPSVVVRITWLLATHPGMKQSLVETHERVPKEPAPLGRLPSSQVVPPSVVRITCDGPDASSADPTATQVLAEAHVTESSWSTTWLGRVSGLHVAPPSVE
jgi:hypothetical protein